MAEPHYVAVSPHNYNSTVMALASTVHASAVMPNFLITEYFVRFAEVGTQISNQLLPENGFIPLPDAPGLGVDINMDALNEFAYRTTPQEACQPPPMRSSGADFAGPTCSRFFNGYGAFSQRFLRGVLKRTFGAERNRMSF